MNLLYNFFLLEISEAEYIIVSMDFLEVAIKIGLSFLLGAAIGIEREMNEKRSLDGKLHSAILGLRSFSLIGVSGTLIGFLFLQSALFATVIATALSVLFIAFYVFDSMYNKDIGVTTEIAMFSTLVIGFVVSTNAIPFQAVLMLEVIILLLLSQKDRIKDAVDDIRREEINAFLIFAIIAFVVLPFLPNQSFALEDIPNSKLFFENIGINVTKITEIDFINPFKLWLVVILITGVDLAGYVLEKTIGKKKGWILASIIGGFVSSTATTISLAQESKGQSKGSHLLGAALLSNAVSFIQILLLILVVNTHFFVRLAPFVMLMFAVTVGLALFFMTRKETDEKIVIESKLKIINLSQALKFGAIFLVISVVSKLALALIGETGFLITTGVGAVAGLDAVLINASQLAGKTISTNTAVWAFVIANAVNLIAKIFYSYTQGSKFFVSRFALSVGIIILISFTAFLK